MPVDLAALAALDAAQQQRQAQIATAAGLAVMRMWSSMRAEDVLARSSTAVDRFLASAVPVVQGAATRSAESSARFFTDIRALHLPLEKFAPPPVDPPSVEQIRTSLFVTGVVGARKRITNLPSEARIFAPPPPAAPDATPAGAPDVTGLNTLFDRQRTLMAAGRQAQVDEALTQSGQGAAAASMRHTANGGRAQIRAATTADIRAVGYARITHANPCYFCAMLASRGGVYKDDSFDDSDPRFEGPGTAKVHDSCHCTLRPLYSRNPAEVPEFNRAMKDLWNSGEMGDGPVLLAWRHLYESRRAA